MLHATRLYLFAWSVIRYWSSELCNQYVAKLQTLCNQYVAKKTSKVLKHWISDEATDYYKGRKRGISITRH